VTGTRVPRAPGGWDAGQMVAALYHTHYRSLVQIAALLAGSGEGGGPGQAEGQVPPQDDVVH
jgi:hypothetical protein